MISQLVSVLDNALLQGCGYGVAVVGLAIAFRVLRYPDLTADGSFLIGAAVFGATLLSGWPWPVAMCLSALSGGIAGGVTALLHTKLKVNRLLTGILTAMMCYSIAFWILSGRSNINLSESTTIFSIADALGDSVVWFGVKIHPVVIATSVAIAVAVVGFVYVLLLSDLGVILRATGENESLVESLGRKPARYHTVGLVFANTLIGFAGSLIAARQGFADVNMGVGVIITLVAALVIGEEIARLLMLDPARNIWGRAASGVLGACVYFFLYLLIVRASILGWIPFRIQPTDLKLMSALIVVLFVAIRGYSRSRTEEREELLPM